jgi:hypothetical protein
VVLDRESGKRIGQLDRHGHRILDSRWGSAHWKRFALCLVTVLTAVAAAFTILGTNVISLLK